MRCSDRAAAELAARQALRAEQEAARLIIEEELAAQTRQIEEDYRD